MAARACESFGCMLPGGIHQDSHRHRSVQVLAKKLDRSLLAIHV